MFSDIWLLFFFKQKTAYEMRISDWSSDVCSSDLIGTEHEGWRQLLDVLNTERIVTAAGLLGTGRPAIRLGVDYALNRKVFGDRPIGAYQGLQFPLAPYWAELEAARTLRLKAAWIYDHDQPFGSAKVSKAACGERRGS